MNESHREPTLNLNLARAYLAATIRGWRSAAGNRDGRNATHGIPTTQHRCARGFRSSAYDSIRSKPLVQTTGADLLAIIHTNGNCVATYLRRLHNLAVDLGLAPVPVLAKRACPTPKQKQKTITAESMGIIASEKNTERRAYY